MKFNMFPKSRALVILLLIAALCGLWYIWGCGHFSNKEIQNVILISIDTCRADHLSCYGYLKNTTPNIDKIAQESVLFSNAYSPIPITLPANYTIAALPDLKETQFLIELANLSYLLAYGIDLGITSGSLWNFAEIWGIPVIFAGGIPF